MKWELHVHTSETSRCGHVPAEQGVKWYVEKGYTGLVVTDHYTEKTLRDMPGTPEEKVKTWLHGYECACAAGEKYGLRVLFGIEVRLPANSNDFLVLGAEPEFLSRHTDLNQGTIEHLYETVHSAGALLIQAHPYREDKCYPENPEYLDGVEVFNGTPRHENFNGRALEFAEKHPNLIRTSGSDFHRPVELATGGIETDRDIQTGADLCQCLKDGAFTLIECPNLEYTGDEE